VITADTPAARELLTDGVDALLVPPGDPAALAEAVRRVATDEAFGLELARSGRETYVAHASEEILGAHWRALLERAAAGG
jgi:glycosyltransferase involved in cell wall biosynthesis